MKRVLFVASLFVIAVFALSYYYNRKPARIDGQPAISEVAAATPENVVQSTPDLTATVIQSPSPVPTESVLKVTETPNTIVIEPTLDPLLLAGAKKVSINVEPETVAFHPVLKQVVKLLDVPEGTKISGTVLDTDLADVPELSNLGPPALLGDTTALIGFDWLAHSTHWAVDIYNSRMVFGSPARAKVYAVLWEQEAYKYGSSGWNVIVIAKIPEGQDMKGWLLFGTGHLKEDIPVQVGQLVEAGDALGNIGMTGDPKWGITGPHMHYYVVWLKTDGTTEFLNPNNWSAIGTRR